MATYTVVYRDEGDFVDRDAHWYKVTVYRDGESLGVVLGVMDNLTWADALPHGDGVELLSNAAVRLLAQTIETNVRDSSFRDKWELEAVTVPLHGQAARRLVDDGVAKAEFYTIGAIVSQFQH